MGVHPVLHLASFVPAARILSDYNKRIIVAPLLPISGRSLLVHMILRPAQVVVHTPHHSIVSADAINKLN
jgi:ABC-type dipeptide/oligopeptide/nickel transport system permease subunit